MGLLSEGQAWLNEVLGDDGGIAVVYSRRVGNTVHAVSLTARPGRSVDRGIEEGGVSVKWGEADFLIEVADLSLNGQATTPQRGDKITKSNGDVFVASEPETGENCWRHSDITRTLYRIHTKRGAS